MWCYIFMIMMHLLHAASVNGQPQPLVRNPVRVATKVLSGSTQDSCPSDQETIGAKNELHRNISAILTTLSARASTTCGGTSGWRRVAYLDMTDPSQSCPSGLTLKNYSPRIRSCGRAAGSPGCWSTFYDTGNLQYSMVCGRIRGYQFGATTAFLSAGGGLNGNYVNGFSLTHGQSGSRTHIWTFASGLGETYHGRLANHYCRCVLPSAPAPPAFIGNDYFCESGLNSAWVDHREWIFYPDDPLWDGQNCTSSCCQFNHPPYFTKTLPAPTSDSIELRLCIRHPAHYEDVPIDQVEIYVK